MKSSSQLQYASRPNHILSSSKRTCRPSSSPRLSHSKSSSLTTNKQLKISTFRTTCRRLLLRISLTFSNKSHHDKSSSSSLPKIILLCLSVICIIYIFWYSIRSSWHVHLNWDNIESYSGRIEAKTRGWISSNTKGYNEIEHQYIRHPMNWNMPELCVSERRFPISDDVIKKYYRALAKAYLQTFSDGDGIDREDMLKILRRRHLGLTPRSARKGVQSMLIQVVKNRIYLYDPYNVTIGKNKPFHVSRTKEAIWLLSKLVHENRIGDTEFLLHVHDCVQTVNKKHNYRNAHFIESNPSFTVVACNFSNNIPFPIWEGSHGNRDGGYKNWDKRMELFSQDSLPWFKKKDIAVFRGGNRKSMYFQRKLDAHLHCHDVGRSRLEYLSRLYPKSLDVSLEGSCGGHVMHLKRLKPTDFHHYKYVIYAEGNCMWADRIRHQIFGPSVLIKQETACGQFFEPLMKPFEHYIPTDFFFKDTLKMIKWMKENDEEAEQIALRANQFARSFLSLNAIQIYVQVLLEEYSALLKEKSIIIQDGAKDVTVDNF